MPNGCSRSSRTASEARATGASGSVISMPRVVAKSAIASSSRTVTPGGPRQRLALAPPPIRSRLQMAISEDQRALLQLLLESGQDYGDIGELLGISEADVRSRANATLRELGGGRDPDADVALTDYLLGQADPIGRADVVRHLQRDPEAMTLATDLSA